MGVRASRPAVECASDGQVSLEQHASYGSCGTRKDLGVAFSPGRRIRAAHRGRATRARAGGLVSRVFRLLPVLPQQAATITSVLAGCPRTARDKPRGVEAPIEPAGYGEVIPAPSASGSALGSAQPPRHSTTRHCRQGRSSASRPCRLGAYALGQHLGELPQLAGP